MRIVLLSSRLSRSIRPSTSSADVLSRSPCGLVGDEDRWIGRDRARDGDPLLLAAGKLARVMVHALGQSDHAQSCFGVSAPLFFGNGVRISGSSRHSPRRSSTGMRL